MSEEALMQLPCLINENLKTRNSKHDMKFFWLIFDFIVYDTRMHICTIYRLTLSAFELLKCEP